MSAAERESIMNFMREQDVRFVRLAFCDIFGQVKNVSISASSLEKAMEKGVGLNAASIRGFLSIDDSDLFLFPDPKTLTILPWRPSDGKVARFFCSIRHQTADRSKAMSARFSRNTRTASGPRAWN